MTRNAIKKYPAKSFPKILGQEVGGVIVKLPTSTKIVEDPEYKLRNFVVGGRVGVVSGH